MSLMNDLSQYIGIQQSNTAQDNSGFSQLGSMLGQAAKEREDEKRRQDNVKKQMSQAQEMMKSMAQMPNNSSSARAVGTLDDDVQKRRKGVISVSDYVPEQSVTTDETGALNIKMGYRRATPAEQKAQFEMQKSQVDTEKSQAKSDLLSAYVKGEVQEGAILGEMSTLGISADEFDIAAQARERMRSMPQGIPQGFEATEMSRDRMGNLIPSGIKKIQPPAPMAQPTAMDGLREEQARLNIEKTKRELEPQAEPFRFKKEDSVAEQRLEMDKQKFESEMQDRAETRSNKSRAVVDSADSTIEAINELLDKKVYFGPIGGRAPLWMSPTDTDKLRWERNFNFLESKNIVNLIDQMKSQSRTGATGFGQLNREELRVIKDASMILDKGMSEKDAEFYLNKMKGALQKIKNREMNGYDSEQSASPAGTSQQPQGNDIRSQYNALRASGVSAEDAKRQMGL